MSKPDWPSAVLLMIWLPLARGAAFPGADPRGPAPDSEADRAAIEKLEHEWLDAESDRPTFERILASDFLHQVPAGVFLSNNQHIDWSVKHPRPANRKARFEKLEVRLYADTAIASGIVDDTNASGSDLRRSIFTDVFVRRNGQWQAVNAAENFVRASGAAPE
jgi:hypothetical protein